MFTPTIDLAEDHRNQLMEEARRHRLAQLAARPRRPRPRRVAAGLALIATAAATVVFGSRPSEVAAGPDRGAPAALAEVATTDLVYEPSHSSGWHVHPGLHSVVVMSGALTIYDEACRRHDYGPGETYLGGRAPHLARNHGTGAAGLVVTYVADPGAEGFGRAVEAPAGCETS